MCCQVNHVQGNLKLDLYFLEPQGRSHGLAGMQGADAFRTDGEVSFRVEISPFTPQFSPSSSANLIPASEGGLRTPSLRSKEILCVEEHLSEQRRELKVSLQQKNLHFRKAAQRLLQPQQPPPARSPVVWGNGVKARAGFLAGKVSFRVSYKTFSTRQQSHRAIPGPRENKK